MAKKFLYLVAFLVVLFIIGRIGYEMFQDELAEIALVPTSEFTPTTPMEANAYQDPTLWYSRPGIGSKDPSGWLPSEFDKSADGDVPNFAVFFIHPTSDLNSNAWNAPMG